MNLWNHPFSKLATEKFEGFLPQTSQEDNEYMYQYSAAASGWAGLAHPEFGSIVNPITTRGADYVHHITASPSGFENPAASLLKWL